MRTGFPAPRRGEGRVRGASIEKRPERAAALTYPLLRNGPLPLPIGERNSGVPLFKRIPLEPPFGKNLLIRAVGLHRIERLLDGVVQLRFALPDRDAGDNLVEG